MPVRSSVHCSECGVSINRVTWNYGKNRPITTFFCDNRCKGAWQVKQRENLGFTRQWLFDQYITQGKDANQIGREIGRNGKRVWEWIRDYGIPTRPRGANHDQNLVKDGSTFRGKSHTSETKARFREIALADGRVPWGKNNPHPLKGADSKDHPNWRGGLTPERQAFYASPEWAEAVKAVWDRDNATCQNCGKHHNTTKNRGTFHIHHIVSFAARELRAELSNLILLCRICHLWVHSKKNTTKKFIKENASD